MADMADFALDYAIETEHLADDYANGAMSEQEAYEHGLIDESGYFTQDMHFDSRVEVNDLESLNFKLALTSRELSLLTNISSSNQPKLNAKAIANLSKPNPTCNICEEQMQPRLGKYGKFYFCNNYCEGQSTISDTYWQSIRRKE